MDSYDVVIIGAGPAGLRCAKTLGGSKYSVLLLEKNAEIGPKICAGGITQKDIELLDIPQKLLGQEYPNIKFHINGSCFNIRNEENYINTIDRKNLGQWQLSRIKGFDNIEIRTNAEVSKTGKDYLIVNGKKIICRYIVGADGSSSIVKRNLGIKTKKLALAIQYIIPTKKYKEIEFFYKPKYFSAWYAWIFPHKEYVSIGCGSNPKILPTKDLVKNFKAWIHENNIDITNAKYEAFILDYDYQGYRFGNTFLTGDSAGLISGLTGEGIHQALLSGNEVGRMILDENYISNEIKELIKVKKKHNILINFLVRIGSIRLLFLYLLVLLLKIPFTRKRVFNFLA